MKDDVELLYEIEKLVGYLQKSDDESLAGFVNTFLLKNEAHIGYINFNINLAITGIKTV